MLGQQFNAFLLKVQSYLSQGLEIFSSESSNQDKCLRISQPMVMINLIPSFSTVDTLLIKRGKASLEISEQFTGKAFY